MEKRFYSHEEMASMLFEDNEALKDFILNGKNEEAIEALKKVTDLKSLVEALSITKDEELYEMIVSCINAQQDLLNAYLEVKENDVRMKIVEVVTDENTLYECALIEKDKQIRAYIISRLTDKKQLFNLLDKEEDEEIKIQIVKQVINFADKFEMLRVYANEKMQTVKDVIVKYSSEKPSFFTDSEKNKESVGKAIEFVKRQKSILDVVAKKGCSSLEKYTASKIKDTDSILKILDMLNPEKDEKVIKILIGNLNDNTKVYDYILLNEKEKPLLCEWLVYAIDKKETLNMLIQNSSNMHVKQVARILLKNNK